MAPRADIEGLRAVAVALVVAYHAGWRGAGGGFIGVDVFFVVSGFLITSLLLRERIDTGRVDLIGFWARRARRLLPIATTVIATVVVAGWMILPMTDRPRLGRDALASSLFSANWVFAERGTDYLAADTDPSVLQHFWSLGVEEQFYAVWPLLFVVVTIGAATTTAVRRRVLGIVGVIAGASFAMSVATSGSTRTWAYFGTHTRAWELAAGVALATAWPALQRARTTWRVATGWAGLVALGIGVPLAGATTAFPGWIAAIPVLGTVAVLAADDDPNGPVRILGRRPLQWLGAHSYGLYLWHWPALILGGRVLNDSVVADVALIALAVGLSAISLRWMENPVRYASTLVSSSRRSLALGAATVTAAVAVSAVAVIAPVGVSTGVVAASPDAPTATPVTSTTTTTAPVATTTAVPAVSDASTTTTDPTTTTPPTTTTVAVGNRDHIAGTAIRAAASQEIVPDNLRPSLANAPADTPEVYRNGCHGYLSTRVDAACVFGDPAATVAIGLWGDSHAAQWFGPLIDSATRNGWQLVSHTSGGCPVIDRLTWNRGADSDFTHCTSWRAAAVDAFIDAGVTAVVISQHWGLLDADDRRPIDAEQWEELLPVLIDDLRALGVEPILFMDSPDPPESVPGCLSRNPTTALVCAAASAGATERAVRTTQLHIADQYDIAVVDPHRWLCTDVDTDSVHCPAIVGDMLVYRDGHHLSATAARWLGDLVDDVLARSMSRLN